MSQISKPVSYTHLDVYKRQVRDAEDREYLAFISADAQGLQRINDWSGFGQKTTGSGTVKFNQVFVESENVIRFDTAFSEPVSYTHLDVYKRQVRCPRHRHTRTSQ